MNTRLAHLKDRQVNLLAAISAIESGSQSWASPDGMSYTHADLRTLYAELRRVEQEISMLDPSVTGGGFGAQPFSFGFRR